MKRLLEIIFTALVCASILGACAFLGAAKTNVVACAEADPALEAQVLNALVDAAEQQWLAAITALVPDPTLRDCILAGILSAAEAPDGGFTYALPDGGFVAPAKLTMARQLAETDKQRAIRRAQTYFALTR